MNHLITLKGAKELKIKYKDIFFKFFSCNKNKVEHSYQIITTKLYNHQNS